MFMVRKMAIVSSGDPLYVCVVVLHLPLSVGVCARAVLSDARLLLTTLYKEKWSRGSAGSVSQQKEGERQSSKSEKYVNDFFLLLHTLTKSTRLFKLSLGSSEGQRQCLAGCLATPEMKKVKIRQGFRKRSDFHHKRLITAV